MAVDYHENKHLEALLLVLEDHTSWFHKLIQCLFYSEEADLSDLIKKPTSFAQWFVAAHNDDDLPPEIIENLAALHSDLFKASDILLHNLKESVVKPSFNDFKKILTIYEEFLLYIRRLEKEIFLDGSGFDAFTGLRSKSLIFDDIKRELQRLARQGKAFCVAMIKIDDFDFIQKNVQQDESDGYLKLIASLIKLSIRSFDDAYYIGGDAFVLCLKQADVSGGVSALERLRKELERQDVRLKTDGNSDAALSMSCCIAEPVVGDDAGDLIENLHLDLSSVECKKSGSVLEYHELSPLQRYIREDD